MVKPLIAFCALFGIGLAADAIADPAPKPEPRVIVVGDRGHGTTEVPYSDGLTASKAIIAAGGYSDFGQTPIYLVRCAQLTRLDVRAVIERGERDKDVMLRPWDIIVIGVGILRHR